MSKFLKFIVHLVIFCTIICILALAVPSFFGIYTAVNDGTMRIRTFQWAL